MMSSPSSRAWPALGGLLCWVAVGLALLAQHRFDMQPCPWCILQRLLFLGLGAWLLLAAVLPRGLLQRGWAALAVVPAGAGMASALWQHFVASKSASCALTLADRVLMATGLDTRFPEVFEVRANCADAAVSILGIPFDVWSLALFGAMAVLAIVHVSSRRDARH